MPKGKGGGKGKSKAAPAAEAATVRIKKKNYSENEVQALLNGVEKKKENNFRFNHRWDTQSR